MLRLTSIAGAIACASTAAASRVTSTSPADFTHFETVLLPSWVSLFSLSSPPSSLSGNFSFDTIHRVPSVYGASDVAHVLAITNQFNLTKEQAVSWTEALNSFQNASGFFSVFSFEEETGYQPWHAAAYATSAISLLTNASGLSAAYPPVWAEEIASGGEAVWSSTFFPLLNSTFPTCNSIWCAGHKIASIPAVLLMAGKQNTYADFFTWWAGPGFLASHLDAKNTGMWCERSSWAPPNVDCLGGAFHMDFTLTAMGQPLFYPELVFNSSLGLQGASGLWNKDTSPQFIDLDGVYQLTRTAAQLGKPPAMWEKAEEGCALFLGAAALSLNDNNTVLGPSYGANTHSLAGAVAGVAECAKWFPALVKTARPWVVTLDTGAPFI